MESDHIFSLQRLKMTVRLVTAVRQAPAEDRQGAALFAFSAHFPGLIVEEVEAVKTSQRNE